MAKEDQKGKPWKIVKTFSVFEEADLARHELLESGAYQVKVKRTAADLYTVRTRLVKSEQKNSKNKSKGKNKKSE
jgi:hypothetical protein